MAKKAASKSLTPRRHIRFPPDPGNYAKIDLNARGEFKPSLIALLAEEAFGGCGIVVINSSSMKGKLKVGDMVMIQVGRLDPVKAEIKWRADLDALVSRIGLMYLE